MVVEDEGGAAAADGPKTAVAGVARPAYLVLGRRVRGQVEAVLSLQSQFVRALMPIMIQSNILLQSQHLR